MFRESNQRLRNTNKYQRNLDNGIKPKDSADKGNIPKKRYPFPLMLKGER
jgi:hypothetical protein